MVSHFRDISQEFGMEIIPNIWKIELSHTLPELIQFHVISWFSKHEQVFVHDHEEITLHGFLHPIRSALALPLMLYYIFPEDEPDLQEGIQGPIGLIRKTT